jgi:hypothetical protein
LGAVRGPEQYWGVQPQYSIRSAPTYTGFDRSTFDRDDTWQSPLSNDTSYEIDSPISIKSYLKNSLTQPPGIKMIAHGTKCNPRPVYITLHFYDESDNNVPSLEYQNCLTWRAELRKANNSSITDSWKLGNLRKVSFEDILGIHRGKVTTALRRMQTANLVSADLCLSLLTKSGTLDLQCCNADNMSAVDIRECFIDLLGQALRLRGLALKELGHAGLISPIAGQNSKSSVDRNEIAAANSIASKKSSQFSAVPNTGPSSRHCGDANLSVISF